MITKQELKKFKKSNGIVLGLVHTPIGFVKSVVKGHWDFANSDECKAVDELLKSANGVGE